VFQPAYAFNVQLIFAKEEFSAVMGPAPSDAYMLKLSKG
jgi:hypothetical protein